MSVYSPQRCVIQYQHPDFSKSDRCSESELRHRSTQEPQTVPRQSDPHKQPSYIHRWLRLYPRKPLTQHRHLANAQAGSSLNHKCEPIRRARLISEPQDEGSDPLREWQIPPLATRSLATLSYPL